VGDARGPLAIATDAQPGALLAGRYQLTENITRGPAISLWKGEDLVLARPVGVYLVDHAHCDPDQMQHYLANAVSAGQLGHTAVAATFDAHTPGDVSYVVREWVDGVDLGSILEDGPLTGSQIRSTLLPVAELLAEAHARGLTHGRLRPCDVFVTQHSGIKVLGLGTCWSSLSMTIEEAQREDVTALGALIYASATGRWPLPAGPDSPNLPGAPLDEAGQPCLPRQVRAGVSRQADAIAASILGLRPGGPELHTATGVAQALAAMTDQGLSARNSTTTTEPVVAAGLIRGAGASLAGPPTNGPDTGEWWSGQQPEPPVSAASRRTVLPVLGLALLVIGLVVVVALSIFNLTSGGGSSSSPQSAGPTGGTGGTSSSAGPTAQVLTPTGVTDWDPYGDDGQEQPSLVPAAHDGKLDTSWLTSIYTSANLGGLKPGVGLRFDMGKPVSARSIALAFPFAGQSVQVLAGDTLANNVNGYQRVWSGQNLSQSAAVTLDGHAYRYWVIWVTRLAPAAGGYQGGLAEVAFRG
jgi:hypothetical protein